MHYSGMTRKIDKLGRMAIPKSMRKHLGWPDGATIDISLCGHYIMLSAETERQTTPITLVNTGPLWDELLIHITKLTDKDALIILELIQRLTKDNPTPE